MANLVLSLLASSLLFTNLTTAQEAAAPAAPAPQTTGELKQRAPEPASAYSISPGTHILLNMINSVSTKQAQVGDRIYLETAFPVMSGGKIVIPPGSWVTGTVTEVIRPKRAFRGRGGLQVRFDSLTLPNGVTRDFRADLGSLDARSNESLQRENSTVKGPGHKGEAAETLAGTTVSGTIIGAGIGRAAGNSGLGSLVGVAGGAATGLAVMMLTRGPEATLEKGSSVEMVLDRPLTFEANEISAGTVSARPNLSGGPTTPAPRRTRLPY